MLINQILQIQANPKPLFDAEIISAIQKRKKETDYIEDTCLQPDKENFKTAKISLQKMLDRRKGSYIEETPVRLNIRKTQLFSKSSTLNQLPIK